MEQERNPRAGLPRAVVCAASSALAAAVMRRADGRALDVALWALLAPLVVAALLELAWWGRHRAREVRRQRAQVVLPVAAAPELDPRAPGAADQARAQLLAARGRGAPTEELLELARALHEARLELARVTAAAGGDVPQELRDELVLRDRPQSVPSA